MDRTGLSRKMSHAISVKSSQRGTTLPRSRETGLPAKLSPLTSMDAALKIIRHVQDRRRALIAATIRHQKQHDSALQLSKPLKGRS
jgi:hypothetical protein